MSNFWRVQNFRIITFNIILFSVICLSLYAVVHYGSLSEALSGLRGDALAVDAHKKTVLISNDEKINRVVVFAITNRTQRAVTLLGAGTSCTCITTSDLPKTLTQNEVFNFNV